MNRVRRGSLVLGERIGHGGQGHVYPVLNAKAGGEWDAVYKEYKPDVLDRVDVAALEALGDLVAALPEADRLWLGERTAWPTDLVLSGGGADAGDDAKQGEDETTQGVDAGGGTVVGFLMRAVPADYYFALKALTTDAKLRLAQVEFLLNADDYVADIGLTVSERDRLALLADLAATLGRLHALGIAVGDLSPKNLLFSVGPQPRCFLIDCDAVRRGDASVLPQVETTEWQLPEGEQLATERGDAYKFGLLAARLFSRDQSSRDLGALLDVSPALGELAHLSQRGEPAGRPLPARWIPALEAAVRSASTDPAQQTVVIGPPPGPAASGSPAGQAGGRPAVAPRRAGAFVLGAVAILGTIAIIAANSGGGGHSGGSGGSSGGIGGYTYVTPTPGDNSNGSSGVGGDPSPTPSDTTVEVSQLQDIANILADTATARSGVSSAVNAVGGCTEDPASGESTLQSAAASRSSDASRAQQLPVDGIPGGAELRSALVSLLDDSARADSAYAGWMSDIPVGTCPGDPTSDQNYQDGDAASRDATADKLTFVGLWNPLASAFGLTTYTADQL